MQVVRFPHLLCFFALLTSGVMVGSTAHAAPQVSGLRVERLENPLGLDVAIPRFSWVMTSSHRGAKQTAYQVMVASSERLLGKPDIWDSTKVTSDDNAWIPYRGPALAPLTRYVVQVRVWDEKGTAAATRPGFFETGFLTGKPSDWKAQWIGLRAANDGERRPFVGARWLAPPKLALTGKTRRMAFSKRFSIASSDKIVAADLFFVGPSAGQPWDKENAHAVYVNDTALRPFSSDLNDPRRLTVTTALRPGDNQIWIDSPYREGGAIIATLRLETAAGQVRFIQSDRTWGARASEQALPASWRQDSPDKSPYVPSLELGAFGEIINKSEPAFSGNDHLVPVALLRKSFVINKPVARARVYATAAGIYELHVNGARVGDQVLSPGWTDYNKRAHYQTYDVTKQLRHGSNAFGALLSEGWYAGRTGMGQHLWGYEKALRAQLHVTYHDGSSDIIATDGTWRGNTGSIRASDLLDGELVDARKDIPGWSLATFDDGAWRSVHLPEITIPRLEASMDPPIRVTQTLRVKAITTPKPGVQIFDLGQNMTGWIRLRFRAPKGTRVTLRYGEMLEKDGALFTDNLRTARAVDEYIAAGRVQEVFEPKFTFHGFRYVEVSGLPAPLAPTALVGLVVHNDLPRTGSFSTSNAKLNQLQSNIVWGQRGNFVSVPTDCPQRDERLGWTGDIQLFAPTATFNMDVSAFLAKYLVDLQDAQRADGAVSHVAPTIEGLGYGSYGWGDAIVLLPYLLYQTYGDTEPMQKHYGAMKKWVDFRTQGAKGFLNTSWGFGDWVSPPPETPHSVLGPMFHAHIADLLSRMAQTLGKAEDAKAYATLFQNIKQAFNKAHVTGDSKITSDTQTAYVMALRYNLLPDDKRAAAANHLVAAIKRHNNHLNTGFLGTGHLLPALSEVNRTDVATQLLLTETYPSWLFSVNNGATTMWERWNSYTPETGPVDLGGMNSYNHYAFGAVGAWMYATLGGLRLDPVAPAFRRIIVRPEPGGELGFVKTRYQSIRGEIAVAWRQNKRGLLLDLQVPVHATAEVHIPTPRAEAVLEAGRAAVGAPGLKLLGVKDGHAVFEAGAGTYQFTQAP